MSESTSGQIDHVLDENRLFPPSANFVEKAVIQSEQQYQELYERARENRDEFWKEQALEHLHWFEPFSEVCRWDAPNAQWFLGGKTNASYNCLDRNIEQGRGDKTAIIWEGEPGDTRSLTFSELKTEVCKCAAALRELGIGKGDVVSIYMPMTPELAVAMLACARIGAVHSVIFAGFSAESIADRNNDASAKMILTSDGLHRRGKVLKLKETVDEALEKSPTIEKCLVLKRVGNDVSMKEGRDVWWHDVQVDKQSGDFPQSRWTANPHCSFSTLVGSAPANPRAFATRRPVTTCGPSARSNGCLIIATTTSIGARPTAVGSPDTATSCTGPLSAGATCVMYEGSPQLSGGRSFLGHR